MCPDLSIIVFICHFFAFIVTGCIYLSLFALTVKEASGI